MKRIAALLLAASSASAPRIPDASETQRLAAAGAFPAALSAGAVPMDIAGTRPGRIFYGYSPPAQVVEPALFPSAVQAGIGVGTAAWPMLPKRRVGYQVP